MSAFHPLILRISPEGPDHEAFQFYISPEYFTQFMIPGALKFVCSALHVVALQKK